ncbi:MAG TPA: hypothetical protein VN493_11705 [Thermoanaerobaculia bacterium]|nr:hypothetical protein [Thermoanaerobaculia bacterium]
MLLSSVEYGAFLSYTPRPTPGNEEQARSKRVCHGIKQDAYWDANTRLIPFAADKLKEGLTPELADLLAPDVVLVPTPGSAPMKQRDALWVPRRICQELVAVGLGGRWEPWLARHTAVQKSAFASRGQRPSAQVHYDSMRVERRVTDQERPTRITLVDDVLTKGSTLLAGASLLAEAFPGVPVRVFALIRTMGFAFVQIADPVYGEIIHGRYGAFHKP